MSESTDHDPILIEMEDDLLHTEEQRFCYDPTCGCHEDPLLIAEVAQDVTDGLFDPTGSDRPRIRQAYLV